VFSPLDPFLIALEYSQCSLFRCGEKRTARNVMHGRLDGVDVKAFDYTFESGTGSFHQAYTLSCVILDTGYMFRFLMIRPERVADRISEAMRAEDIDFESDEFSRAFHVKSEDKKYAYDVIHARMMQFLLDAPRLTVQLVGRSVIIYDWSSFSAEGFRGAIAFGREFLGLLPDYLTKEMQMSQEGE